MRIGIITHNFPATSKERKDAGVFLQDFAVALSKEHKVFILSPHFTGDKEVYKNTPVTYFSWRGGKNKLGDFKITSPQSFIHFLSLIRNGRKAAVSFAQENKLDFILAAWALPSGDFAYVASKKTKIPYAVWTLGSDMNKFIKYPILKGMIVRSLRSATLCFANSYSLIKKVEKITNKSCEFLPAVTDLQMPTGTRRKQKHFSFLFVGRLEKVKGPDVLLEAATKLPKNVNWKIKIGGDGTLQKELESYITNNNLSDHVELLGRLDAHGVSEQMMQADCLVVPSRNESLPLVVIESSRANLPVIVTDVGDCRYIVNKYDVGLVTKSEDPSLLAKSMIKAMKTKNFRGKYRKGLHNLSIDFTQDKVVSLFNSYVKNKI